MNQKKENDVPKVERDGWEAEALVEESTNKDSDETVRQVLRGDETKGSPDKRDIAGSPKKIDTPHGREEEKNDLKR